jgi:phosphate-selective porin OprO/OprP
VLPSAIEPVTVEQLAERLRAMEEMNRSLAEELARTRSEHAEQMKQILSRLDARAESASERSPITVPGNEPLSPTSPLARADAADAVDVVTPVPDYSEGQFAPFQPPPGYAYA